MFNNTSAILRCQNGIILPNSNKVLYEVDIDRRIEKLKNHINYLEGSIAHRNTHGGKRFRAHNISIGSQIYAVSKRLELLEQAKTIFADGPKTYQDMFEAALYGTLIFEQQLGETT